MRRALKLWLPLVGALAAIAVALLLAGGWYFSGELKDGALVVKHDDPEFDLVVSAVGIDQTTLDVTSLAKDDGPWTRDGNWGLEWESGYGQVGKILSISDDKVVRQFFPLSGNPPIGEMVRLDKAAFPGDPNRAFGLDFEEVFFSSPLGKFPAWFVDGPLDTWVIYVHGRNVDRREALRTLGIVADLGYPSLLITYRNDEGAPSNPDGYIRLGQTEWKDLEGAATYALANGAKDLVLVGYSMGGAIIMSFLYRSPLAERVSGTILDSPLIDFGATVTFGASKRRIPVVNTPIPGVLTAVAKFLATWRFDIDFEELDYLSRAGELALPILLFHGDADSIVPIESSDMLAESRPDLVRYIRVAGAVHVGSWNQDRLAYETAVSDFLEGVTE